MSTSALAKFCTSCGAAIDPANKFCTGCGAPVATLPDTADVVPDTNGHLSQPHVRDGVVATVPATQTPPLVGPGQADEPEGGESESGTSPSHARPNAPSAATDKDEAERRADVAAAAFQLLVVREIDSSLDAEGDGLIYPVPAPDATNSIVLEQRDGTDIKRIAASGFKVIDLTGGNARRLSAAADLRIDVIITDSRVAFACSKFTKGGGWTPFGLGALPVTLVLNGVSKARAASRRRGKMLVGQIRYPWLAAAGGATKTGFGTSEQLRLCVGTQNQRLLALDLTLPKNIDSTAVAAEIVRRTARHRIETNDPKVAEHIAEFAELAKADPLPSAKGQFGLRAVPEHWPVDPESARLGLADW
jgi:hypothetical protein